MRPASKHAEMLQDGKLLVGRLICSSTDLLSCCVSTATPLKEPQHSLSTYPQLQQASLVVVVCARAALSAAPAA
jgi:hypothetical protein